MAHPIKRNGIYWLRKKVPEDLRPLVKKTEVKKSLGTRDPAEAKILFTQALAEIEATWAQLRQGPISLSHKQCYGIAGEIYREHVSANEDNPKVSVTWMLLSKNLRQPNSVIVNFVGARPDETKEYFDRIMHRLSHPLEVDAYLQRKGLIIDAESRERLRKAVVDALTDARKQVFEFSEGRYKIDPSADRFPVLELSNQRNATPQADPAAPTAPLLSEALEDWIAEKTRVNSKGRSAWTGNVPRDHRAWSSRFLEVAGDKPIDRYMKSDGRRFKRALMSLPPLYVNKAPLRGLGVLDAAAKALKLGIPTMTDTSVNKIMGFVSGFFNWASANHDEVVANPFDGLRIRKGNSPRDERLPFNAQELQSIFKAALYTGCKSSTNWLVPGEHVPNEGIYWVPLIALFSGARAGEIIQLYEHDIAELGGIHYFNVTNAEEDQKAKTSSSVREIPIHPKLIELGLLEFVAYRRKSGGGRLFPEMGMVDGYYSTAYSQRFSRFLTSIGVKHERNSFHSFRHNFEDACLGSLIPVDITNLLQGHSAGGMAARYGTGLVKIRTLHEQLCKLDYEDLDLSHLKRTGNS